MATEEEQEEIQDGTYKASQIKDRIADDKKLKVSFLDLII